MNFFAATRTVPAPDRTAYWSNVIARHCGRFDIHYPEPRFEGSFDARRICDFAVARIRQSRCAMTRGPRQILTCPTDAYFLVAQLAGRASFTQDGRQAHLTPGNVTLVYTREPLAIEFHEFSVQLVVHVPTSELPFGDSVRPWLARSYPRAISLLVTQMIASAFEQNALFDESVRDVFLSTLLGLVKGVDRPVRGDEEPDPGEDMLYRAIKGYIGDHVMDEEMSPARIARAHNMSERKLYRLFASRGMPPYQFIRKMKLHQAAREIAASTRGGSLITQLAYKYGFSDGSNFTRAFKAEFGVSPRDYQNTLTPALQ